MLKLVAKLENGGFHHAYIDGGTTIKAFLNLKLINEMTWTQMQILLDEGRPLFGKTNCDILVEDASNTAFLNDFMQTTYKVSYSYNKPELT